MNSAHPARDTLAAYGLGKLDPAESATVETHIAECEECCETLLDLGSDTFVERLRLAECAPGTIGLSDSQYGTVNDLPHELAQHPRYRVLELLGKGGMGNVFKAEHTLMNRAVALKVVNPHLIQNAQAVERFRREVRSAAQLAHPNIVAAYDAEQVGNMHLLVMEHVLGDNLSDVVKRDGPLDILRACDYIWQAAQGLQHAHQMGMVHRDIKPHNLMVTSEGKVKILDFGLAALASQSLAKDTVDPAVNPDSMGRSKPQLTSAGSMMGTPDFISPEQAADASTADVRSDIYSLGCTFYYLLTARPPFTEGSVLERVKAHGEKEPDPIEDVRSDIPAELANVVRRMMAKGPAERFQTPEEVADALAHFVHTLRAVPAARRETTPQQPPTASSRRSWWPPTVVPSIACAAFALVLAGLIYIATDNGMLIIDSPDDSVEVIIRSANGIVEDGSKSNSEIRIVDTLTGSVAKRLRSGEYILDLKDKESDFELDNDHFVLRRGGTVIVTVTRRDYTPTVRKVWEAPTSNHGTPSPDGRYLAITDWETGDLAVLDLTSGVLRRLTDKGPWTKSPEYAELPVWSPDGERIAYSWLDKNGQYALRMSMRDGSDMVEIYRNESTTYIHPFDWSTDGDILATLEMADKTTRLALVSVADHTARSLESMKWGWPHNASMSPDGRYVVYDARPEESESQRDIFILSTDGNSKSAVVEHPENDFAPVWAPDGKHIVFTSDRNGSVNLWVMPIENARSAGPATAIGVDMRDAAPMGFADDGTFFYATKPAHYETDIYVAEIDTNDGKSPALPEKLISRFEGSNELPAWSPDGKSLAYVSRRGDRVLVIRSLESEDEEVFSVAPSRRARQGPIWSADRQSILIIGSDDKGRAGIFAVDVDDGVVTPIRLIEGATVHQAVWFPPDRKRVLYLQKKYDNQRGITSIVVWDCESQEESVLHQFTEKDWSDRWLTAPHSLTLSPDGQQIAYTTLKEITIEPVASGKPRVVARVPEDQNIPTTAGIAWTPDGHLIYATTDQGEYFQGKKSTRLWRVPVGGGKPREMGLAVDDLRHLAIHPDGRRIAYYARFANQPSVMNGLLALENFLPIRKAEK